MDANRIKAEIFETHYNDIKSKVKARDFVGARHSTIYAAKYLYEQAKNTSGDKRRAHLRQADALYKNIFSLDRLIAAEEKKKKSSAAQPSPTSPKKTPEDQVMGGKKSGGEDGDQRVFEALPVPDVSFDDVAGLYDVKEAVQRTIIEPRLHPELYDKYQVSAGGGILMYGPPGVGKTLIAKAVAHEVNAEFFSLRCSELVSKYFGGTEQNIGLLFETARSKKNAVIFFDEFEALAIGRDKNHSSVMRRVVTELLTQMQGIKDAQDKDSTLLVLAATNMPWMVDSAFMRPGRFDERIYVGLPDDDARMGILTSNISKVPCAEALDYPSLVERTAGFNCADIVQLTKKAKILALEREKQGSEGGIAMQDFDKAFETCHSSVMRSDIEKLMAWRKENGEA